MKYLPIAGTWGQDDGWVIDNADPFTCELARYGLEPLRRIDGTPLFNWPAKLSGLPFLRRKYWQQWGLTLGHTLIRLPYIDRNLIAHSHGGQLAIIAAANGVKIRTLTTIATPRRKDVPAEIAVNNIGYWQHVFDPKKDWTATVGHRIRRTLGQLGDGDVSLERRFLIPGIQNIGIPKVSHSNLFHDPTMLHWLADAALIDGILRGPGANGDRPYAPDPKPTG
jgi:hypothetical protein